MRASIVINTLNRRALLQRTLQSLKFLHYPDFEVIVVNGPSVDGSEELLKEWSPYIKVENCPEANLSMSRNIGIAASSGEIVAFIDDDAIPEQDWMVELIAGFDQANVAAVGGKVWDNTGHKFQYQFANADRLGNGVWNLLHASPNQCFPKSFEFPYLQGTNAAFRRTALVDIGGFDEAYAYYLDETDVCLRLMDAGYFIRQLDRAFVHHMYAPSHIRKQHVATNRFPVLKSKIYYSHRNAKDFCSEDEIERDNNRFIENHRNDILNNVAVGRLSHDDLAKFDGDCIRASMEARDDLAKGRKLLAQKDLPPTFKPFLQKIDRPPNRLRIVLLCEDYPPRLLGGIARFTQDKATALARLGHVVHVIATGEIQDTVDFEDGVWVHRIVPRHQPLSEIATGIKVPVSHWNQSRTFLEEIDRIAQRGPISIVEGPVWNCVGIAPIMSGRYKTVTSLQTTLALSLTSRPDLTSDALAMRSFVEPIIAVERSTIEKCDRVLAISAAIADEVETCYRIKIPTDKLYVSHLGMPDWSCRASQTSDTESLRVLFVGRLEKRKGIDTLLSCIPELARRHSNITFEIVGDDSFVMEQGLTYRDAFSRQNKSLISSGRVVFYGKVDDAELRNRYAACDVFVAPSRFESFGLIFLEAMMFAKPVIGTTAGGMPEVVTDGVTGILVKPGDPISLSAAIDTLIIDSGMRQAMGSAGRQRYLTNFTDAHMAKQCEQLYLAMQEDSVFSD